MKYLIIPVLLFSFLTACEKTDIYMDEVDNLFPLEKVADF